MSDLKRGIHEQLLTNELQERLEVAIGEGWWTRLRAADELDRPERLARHLYELARRTLADVPGKPEEKLARQVEVTNRIVALLRDSSPRGESDIDDLVRPDASLLLEVQPPSAIPLERIDTGAASPERQEI